MKKSIMLGAGVGILGIATYMYLKNKKAVNPTGTATGTETGTTTVANEPTQITGVTLPDGTTATGASNIAPNPVDTVQKPTTSEPAPVPASTTPSGTSNTAGSVLSTVVWQVNNSMEANRLSKEIEEKKNAVTGYKTVSTRVAVVRDINALTQKMFDLGYAPNLKGGVLKIDGTQGSDVDANTLSQILVGRTAKWPTYKKSGTLRDVRTELYNLNQKIIDLGYVPDLKGGTYKIV